MQLKLDKYLFIYFTPVLHALNLDSSTSVGTRCEHQREWGERLESESYNNAKVSGQVRIDNFDYLK